MKRIFAVLLSILILYPQNIYAAQELSVSAQSAVLIDASSGRVLFSKNEHQKRAMASTTKIMTAILGIENSKPDEIIKTSPRAAHVEGSSIWLEENEEITMENALYGLMLNSGNDVAVAIAEHVGGTVEKFVEMMNKKAQEIGAKDTRFQNPNGLDADGHYTTAYDLALISRYAMQNNHFSEVVKTKERKIPWQDHTWNRLLKNHNKLLWSYPYAEGVKTGFTKKAKRCLVSSASKDGVRLIAVTLNAGDDWNDHKKMFEYGFSTFKNHVILDKNQFMKTIVVNGGKKGTVHLGVESELSMLLLDGEEDKIRLEYNVPDFIEAPVTQNQTIGQVDIYLADKKVGSVPLKPLEYVEKADTKRTIEKIILNWIMLFNSEKSQIT